MKYINTFILTSVTAILNLSISLKKNSVNNTVFHVKIIEFRRLRDQKYVDPTRTCDHDHSDGGEEKSRDITVPSRVMGNPRLQRVNTRGCRVRVKR